MWMQRLRLTMRNSLREAEMRKKLTVSQGLAATQAEVDRLHAAANDGKTNPIDTAAAKAMRADGTLTVSPLAFWIAMSAAEAAAKGVTEAVFVYEHKDSIDSINECKRTGNWPWGTNANH